MMQRFKILISAYACSPYQGSEEGVGWGWVRAIAPYHNLWVITAQYHRHDIERGVAEEPERFRNVHFHYVPHRFWHYRPEGLWLKIASSGLKPIMHQAYRSWLRSAGRIGKQLNSEIGFDIVHQVTYVGFRFPGSLWKLDVPFVWGPIGGMGNVPWRLLPLMGPYGMLEYAGRNVVNTMHKALLRGPKKAFQRSSAVIAATSGTREGIKKWYGRDSKVICEIGLPPGTEPEVRTRKEDEPFRMVWSGLHLPRKALNLLLGALPGLDAEVDWELDILGEGPCTKKWRRMAVKKGIDGRCRWHGWVERSTALDVMRRAHVFVITSLRDLTSTVVVEALALGLPVICTDLCGFADVVTNACGLKVPVQSHEKIEYGLRAAIVKLADDEGLRMKFALGAVERAKAYSWKIKAKRINEIYRDVMSC